ncbi:MAG: class I SAM-dependent methyltransferase [Candidatus Curtissbacteria bacterium]|nr:class I SAM-dependent methyltransferase [Candidatus Curtissbacteria bacterium]
MSGGIKRFRSEYGREYFEEIQKIDNPERREILKWDLGFLKSKKARIVRILDVGCGLGEFLGYCDSEGMKTYGIEHSEFAVRIARKNTKASLIRLDVSKRKWPYPDKFFDAVCAFDLLEHVENSGFVIGEARRVLKPEGVLLATTPNGSVLSQRILPYDPTHINVQDERFWRESFTNAGFADLSIQGCLMFGFPPSPLLRKKIVGLGLPVKVGPIFFPLKRLCATLFIIGFG